jgi:hypothetical protein
LTVAGLVTAPLWADGAKQSYSSYGTPGLIDTPVATSAPDAELTTTVFHFGDTTRTTIGFQVTDRLHASFRYSGLRGLGGARETLYDRSFDLHYRFIDESDYMPAVAVGLRDFVGTGVYSSEYIVATKTLSPKLTVTGGVGWGRLSDSDEINRRRASTDDLGGQIEAANWFQGDAAFFGGVAYQATDKLQLKLEYSTDRYVQEVDGGLFKRENGVNFGIDYRWNESMSLQAFYMYGSTFGAAINLINNPKASVAPTGIHSAPFPIRPRGSARDLGWTTDPNRLTKTRDLLAAAMKNEGLVVEGMDLRGSSVRIDIRNNRYDFNAEAIGRTVRVLSQMMPDSVETFTIVPVVRGIPASAVTIQRSDAERFEHAPKGEEQMLARAVIGDGPLERAATFDDTLYPKFTWGLGPYFRASYFDPSRPIRFEVGARFDAEYNVAPGLFLSGSVRHRFGGTLDESTRESNSVLPRVRSETNIYDATGDTTLEKLTADYYFKPGKDLYGRVSAGYLEAHFGGVSAEMLWKPVQSPFAIGVEANYVRQRDFDQAFGFRDYEVATGHVSGYWNMGNGFHAQVDAGRYLAGDWGSTVTLSREFANGWKVGAYATLTDVSFEDFGEGSFDKGLTFTVPLSPFLGKPTRRKFEAKIQPLTRDGGARLNVDGRLYDTVREYHGDGLEDSWGRFWR